MSAGMPVSIRVHFCSHSLCDDRSIENLPLSPSLARTRIGDCAPSMRENREVCATLVQCCGIYSKGLTSLSVRREYGFCGGYPASPNHNVSI